MKFIAASQHCFALSPLKTRANIVDKDLRLSKPMSDHEEKSEKTVIITTKVDGNDRTPALEPYLIQLSGRETGQTFNLTNRNVKIGRDATCEISLDDPHISRHHAELRWQNDRAILKDLGSTNGIVVNGKRISEQVLNDGDKILIGTRLYFKFCYQDSTEQNYQQNLFKAANIDSLTQVYNKKFFSDILSKEFSFSKRNNQPLSLLMIDIDHFKKINDSFGHMAGDHVLKIIGAMLKTSLRMENIACRYGGEEFSIILRNVHSDLALQIAERLRKTIEAEKIAFQGNTIVVTVSIGVATLDGNNFDTMEDLIQCADRSLYEAKETGRNRTVLKKAA